MKASIAGIIECKDETKIKDCSKILNRYNIKHTNENNSVLIDTSIKVTPWFEREKFEYSLYRKLSELGRCKIRVTSL